jgi:hypothetical protein
MLLVPVLLHCLLALEFLLHCLFALNLLLHRLLAPSKALVGGLLVHRVRYLAGQCFRSILAHENL